MTHWRTPRCEGRGHSRIYCTYPQCECDYAPTGELRDDNVISFHGDVHGVRSGRGTSTDATLFDADRVSGAGGEDDGPSAFHREDEARDIRMRAEADEPIRADERQLVINPASIVSALVFMGILIIILVVALRAAGAR